MSSYSKKPVDTPEEPEVSQGVCEIINYDDQTTKRKWKKKLPKNKKNFKEWVTFFEASPSNGLTTSQMFLYNEDLKPVEIARRKWKWWHFVSLWLADSLNVNSWQIAGTGVEAGLTWWETWIAIWIGYSFAACLIVLTQRIGSYAHISFPVACRASFGVYGSVWPVINRVVLAIIWFGTQTWILGQLVQLILFSIFGPNVNRNIGLGNLSGTTVFGFVAFFLGWLIQLPAIWLKPHTVRHFYTAKAIIAPTVSIAFLVWTLVRAHGAGDTISNPVATVHGSDRAWAWINMIMSCISNYAALVLNAPDFSRFARRPSDSTWSQGISIPVSFSLTSLIGLLVASASKSLMGQIMWNPLDVLQNFVDGNTAGDRAGVFFISAGLIVAQMGTNIVANSLAAGTDLAALVPRFMTIRRGGYVCAILGLCICPWHFFETGSTFTTYLSAYSIFLSSISGVIVADYFWLRRGRVLLYDLYSNKKGSAYMYGTIIGCNWRAYAAYLLSLVPNMPGFAGVCGRDVPMGAIKLYRLNYVVGFFISFILYVVFNLISPPDNTPKRVRDHMLDIRKPWLEKNLDVEEFSEIYRYGTGLGVIGIEPKESIENTEFKAVV